MTSKEALNILSSYIETEMGSDDYYKVKEAYKVLEKDLEVLEILKPYFNGAVFPSAINFNFSEEEWESIKEWLDA